MGNSPYGISIRQMPKLASITMCFWLRFPAPIVINNKSYYPMITYHVSGRRYQEFALNWYPNRDRTEPGMQVAFKTWRRNNKYLPRFVLFSVECKNPRTDFDLVSLSYAPQPYAAHGV